MEQRQPITRWRGDGDLGHRLALRERPVPARANQCHSPIPSKPLLTGFFTMWGREA
jgi:hypothetical protein